MNNFKGVTSGWKTIFIDNADKVFVGLAVVLIPLFFLPITSNYLELNKQVMLLLLIFVGSIFAVLKFFSSRDLKFSSSSVDIAIVAFVVVYVFSTIFSLSKINSFWGWSLGVSASLLTLFLLVLLYLLITIVFHDKKTISLLIWALVISGSITTIISILQLFGKFIFPIAITRAVTFNTIGTPYSAALFSAVFLPITVAISSSLKGLSKVLLLLMAILMLLNIVMIGSSAAWVVLAVEMVIFFIIGMYLQGSARNLTVATSIIILLISLVFIVLQLMPFNFLNIPAEVAPSNRATIEVVKQSVLTAPFLGTGPGTFIYDYSKFKPGDVNQTAFWSLRFESGSSEILNKAASIGVFGALILLLIFLLAIWSGLKDIRLLIKEKAGSDTMLYVGVFVGMVGLILSHFLYSIDFVLWSMFWVFMALLMVLGNHSKVSFLDNSGIDTKKTAKIFSVLFLVVIFGFILVSLPKYLGEVEYSKARNNTSNIDETIGHIEKAINLNPSADVYYRSLASVNLVKLQSLLGSTKDIPQEMIDQIQALAINSSQASERASALGPNNVENWISQGFIYQNLVGVVDGADLAAIKAYQKAVTLEPLNPYIFTEIARVYIGLSGSAPENSGGQDENLKLASDNINTAISIKTDYIPAHFLQAIIYAKNNNFPEAVKKLEEIKTALPDDADLAFQLGVMYYNNNQLEDAKLELERALGLNENSLGSHYFLGLITDRMGDKDSAISHFQILSDLDPKNTIFEKILSNLRKGDSALTGLDSGEATL